MEYFENELYELRRELVKCKTGEDFYQWCLENGNKNTAHYGYLAGVLDALYWSEKISQEYYTKCYKALGL